MSQLYQSARIFTEPQIEVTLNDENVVVNVIEASPEIEVTISQAAYWGAIQGTLSNQTDLQNALNAKVPYTGATGNVNLGEYGITSGYVQLDTTPTTYTAAVGNIGWNDTVGTIETTLKGGNVVLKHGRDMFERIVNKTGGALNRTAYQAVRISTAQGQRLGVALAQANNDNNSADTIGLVVEDIAVNQEGYIYTVGEVGEINTTGSLQGETWADGDVLYLSPTTAGRITNVKPVAPQHLVVIGYVVYAHQNHGKIYVKVMNGWEIGELHDVRITSPTNGQVLKYNSSLGVWENNTDAAGTGTVTSILTSSPITGGTITTSGTIGIQQATGSQDGYLSATDWTTFNNKQNALTNPVTGTGTSGQVAYWSGSTTQTGSNNLFWDAANSRLGVGTNAPARTFDVNGLAGFTGTTSSDGGQLGSELLSSSGWTSTGWTGSFGAGYTHTVGNTNVLSNTLAAINNSWYYLVITVTNRTAGTFNYAFGGFSNNNQSSSQTRGFRATSTGNLQITPTSDFDGTLVISIKLVTASSASIELRNSLGTVTNEIRNDSSNTNTIIGTNAGSQNLAVENTFIGSNAGRRNITGTSNVFIGHQAGLFNVSGVWNTYIGRDSGQNGTTAEQNSFYGAFSGTNITTGFTNNSYFGVYSGNAGTSGLFNNFFGHSSGRHNVTGSSNVAIGNDSGRYNNAGSNLTTVNTSVFVGNDTRANADAETNQIVIGYQGRGLGSNTTVIGNSSTTFGRWWGNLLIGTSTNAGQALQVSGISSFTGTTASDGGQLGSELLGSGGWTLGAGWTGTYATGFAHSSGTATLTNTLAAVNGTYYQIAYTVTGRTAGSFTIAFGGYTSGNLTATGSVGPRATSTGTVVITPTTDFNGTIVFSIKIISASSASIQLRNSSGTVTNEIRNDVSNTNTLIGINAGSRNLGTSNTFVGTGVGNNNTTGIQNTFVGRNAGANNTIGGNNSFFGLNAGTNNTEGSNNSFFGLNAGLNNTTAGSNSFFGQGAGQGNTTGGSNSFFGQSAGQGNTTGGSNSFFGFFSGLSNTTGSSNSFFGQGAGQNSTTGSNNSFYGVISGRFIASGANLTVANNSVFLGYDTRANADSETNQTVIGYQAIGLGSNTTVIGNSSTTFGRWWGNLLIGTSTNAGFALDVNGTARISGTSLQLNNGTSGTLDIFSSTPIINFFSAGGYSIGRSGTNMYITSSGTIRLEISSNAAYTFDTSNGHLFRTGLSGASVLGRITTGGNFVIGSITDNGYRLDVQGTLRVTGASQFEGNVTLTDADNLVFGTTTGTKIGTETTQKLGFWNATPIVQPTTAVAAATRVGGGGTTLTDTDTFDGYTLAQIVKALRNTGILA